MSGWHSLQGYLGYRSSGALGRLKGKKRLWFVFDDIRCRLLFYKSESEAGCGTKPPAGTIDMRSAAIALNVNDPNQFVIHSLGKEYSLSAETHESTMIWLLALQAKRDAFNTRLTLFMDQTQVDYKEREEVKRKESLPSDHELRQMIHRAMCAENSGGPPVGLLRSQSVREQRSSSSHSRANFYGLNNSTTGKRTRMVHHDQRYASNLHGHRQSIDLGSFPAGVRPLEILDSRTRSAGSLVTTDSEDTDLLAATTTTTMDELGDWFPVDADSNAAVLAALRRLESVESANNEDEDDEKPVQCHKGTPVQSVSTNTGSSCSEEASTDATIRNSYTSLIVNRKQSGESKENFAVSDKDRLKEMESLLVSSKVELTKSLSREASLQDVLEEKVSVLQRLEARLKESEERKSVDSMGVNGNSSPSLITNSSHEKCRILQNQNRFLNEEVLKLSRMWQQEKMNFLQQNQRLRETEIAMDHLKQDYVFLLQSSIRTAGGEGPDFIEVPIYGGSKHKDRVTRLLDEARKVNPSLPSLEGMAKSGCHVDSYGFRHCYTNEGLMLHYLCGQLHQHYSSQLASAEQNQLRWKEVLQKSVSALPRTKEVKRLVRSGVPNHLRAKVWGLLVQEKVRDIQETKGHLYYNHLCSMISDSETVAHHRRQISLDLLRTMPSNVHFNECDSDGVKKMQEVLQVFCLHNPEVGYCQGMNFIVGMALLFMKPDDAFWFLVAITERYFPPHYFDQNLMGAQADQNLLKNLLNVKMPNLAQHLNALDIELSTVTLNWFLSIFFDSVPLETLLRIWDCFLYEGPKVLFRFSVAILKMTETCLLERTSTISVMRQLKASSRLCYDVEGLMKTAFEDLKPFPRRAEIVSKQACYLKTLKEKHKKRNMEREVLETKEKLLDVIESANTVIECAAVVGNDTLWLCEGTQSHGRIMEVFAVDGTMQWLNIKLDSRIMCIHCVSKANVMLLGSLSHCLYAYNIATRELIWMTPLNDAVLSVCSQVENDRERIYAALADGTVAVIERLFVTAPDGNQCATDIDYDVFYIMIGSGPVSSLSVVEKRLWCACGNRVVILHARTLDIIDQFTVSGNSLDIVSSITDSRHGVWILLRGSSTFQLWDPQNLVCRTMFDVKENKCPKVAHETQFSAGWRVTAILPVDGSLWVGTGDGHLFVYDIQRLPSRTPSAFNTPNNGEGPDGLSTSLDSVNRRIEELYLNQDGRNGDDANDSIDGSSCEPPGDGQKLMTRGRSDSGYQTVGDGSKDSSASQHERESVQGDGGSNSKRDSGDFEEEDEEIAADGKNGNGNENENEEEEDNAVSSITATLQDNNSGETAASSSLETASPTSEALCVVREPAEVLKAAVSIAEDQTQPKQFTRLPNSCVTQTIEPTDTATVKPAGRSRKTAIKCLHPRRSRRTLDKVSRCRLSHSMSTYELSSKSTWNEKKALSSASSSLSSSPRQHFVPTNRRSYDDVSHLLGGSGDSLLSSPTCDSFDFDDVFVTYTEDERYLAKTRIRAVIQSQESKITESICLAPRFILLTDEGSTGGGEGGSSSGCGNGGGLHNDDEGGSKRPTVNLLGSNFLNRRKNGVRKDKSVLRRRKDCKRSSVDSAACMPVSKLPVLVIGSHKESAPTSVSDHNNHHHHHHRFQSRDDPHRLGSGTRLQRSAVSSAASSLDDLSSVSHVEYDSVQDAMGQQRNNNNNNKNVERLTVGAFPKEGGGGGGGGGGGLPWKGSDSGSFVSFSESDVPYSVELTLREKQKIADRPVRCLINLPSESSVVSCSGTCSDSRSILKWLTDKTGVPMMWNSRAIVCIHSMDNPTADKCGNHKSGITRSTSPSANSIVHATSNLVGSSLARVHTIISNLGSDMPISSNT